MARQGASARGVGYYSTRRTHHHRQGSAAPRVLTCLRGGLVWSAPTLACAQAADGDSFGASACSEDAASVPADHQADHQADHEVPAADHDGDAAAGGRTVRRCAAGERSACAADKGCATVAGARGVSTSSVATQTVRSATKRPRPPPSSATAAVRECHGAAAGTADTLTAEGSRFVPSLPPPSPQPQPVLVRPRL